MMVVVLLVVMQMVVTADPRELILCQIQFLICILNSLSSFSVRASGTLLVHLILSTDYLFTVLLATTLINS